MTWTKPKPQSSGQLATHLADRSNLLGTLTVQAHDLKALLAAETNLETLDLAITRSLDASDKYQAIEAMARRVQVKADFQTSLKMAALLSDAMRGQEARTVLVKLKPRGQAQTTDLRHARAKMAISCADFNLARSLIDASSDDPVPVIASLMRDYILSLMARGEFVSAETEVTRLRALFPTIRSVAEAEAEVISVIQGAQPALDYIEACDLLAPEGLEFQRIKARMLAQMGRHLECLDYAKACIEAERDRFSMFDIARHAALLADRHDEFEALVETGAAVFPGSIEMLEIRCAWLCEQGGMEAAAALLPDIRARSEWSYLSLALMIACQGKDLAAAYDALEACRAGGLRQGWSEFILINHLYFHHGTPENIARAQQMLEAPMRNLQSRTITQRTHFRLLIALNDLPRLRADFEALPNGMATSADLAPIGLYLAAQSGDDATARQGWQSHMTASSHPALNARAAYPEQIALKYHETEGDVLVFVTIFNGIEFIYWFLSYYRALGVDHFFFIDNGSTDGTFEALLEHDDVSVFQALGSFSQAACGVFWANHLMRRFGVGHWCLHLDMDEGFVYPGMETRDLRCLLSYLDANGFETLQCTMVDMYPRTLDASGDGNPFEKSRYFDRDYYSMAVEFPPYNLVQGGLRARLSGRSLMMNKAPLIRMAADSCYILNNHYHTHLRVADITCAVLHYKFVGDILSRIDEAIERREHFMGARFYKALRDPLDQNSEDSGFLSPFTVEYAGPQSLVEAGLMQTSPNWSAEETKP
jgi:hypothetical protein